MKLTVVCVRCGTWAEFNGSDLGHCEAEARKAGWNVLRGETHEMRHGRCPAHAIHMEGGQT